MGLLAESKRSSKISRDPNNVKWTKNADSFGQKIMRSQGWAPGQYLGAQDAAQADTYTAANASYIRVSMKDDMKGLGFNKAKEDQVTGLDVFSDLLSRLNGKSEAEVEDGRQARMAVQANFYVEQKWGPMRFVRGGLLVGDEVKSLEDEVAKSSSEDETMDEDESEKKAKKRKVVDVEEEDGEDEEQEESEKERKKRRKEERKSKKKSKKVESSDASDSSSEDEEKAEKKAKKASKKSKKSKAEDTTMEDAPAEEETKAERKERRRQKKEEKRRKKEAKKSKNGSDEGEASASAVNSALVSGTSTPTTGTGTSTPRNRNFVRSRFIAQKKQAVLDTKALNQIFMMKA